MSKALWLSYDGATRSSSSLSSSLLSFGPRMARSSPLKHAMAVMRKTFTSKLHIRKTFTPTSCDLSLNCSTTKAHEVIELD